MNPSERLNFEFVQFITQRSAPRTAAHACISTRLTCRMLRLCVLNVCCEAFWCTSFDSGSFHFVLKGCWFLPNMEQKSAEFLAGGGLIHGRSKEGEGRRKH